MNDDMTTDLPPLRPLPDQPAGVPWPTHAWASAAPETLGADSGGLARLLDELVGDEPHPVLGQTFAAAVVHRGRIVAERYGIRPVRDLRALEPNPPLERLDATSELLSWSMAKSLTHLAVGVAVGDGRFTLSDPVPEPAWSDPDDPRRAITWDDLLTMRPGLRWREEYVIDTDQLPDVVEMLFGRGAGDTAGFAAEAPWSEAAGQPDAYRYSSGSTNIVAANLQRTLGLDGDAEGFDRWVHDRILDPIGMSDTRLEFDAAGTFVGSSYVHTTLQNWCRFGLLALRDGRWDGMRIVPEGWMEHGRRPRSADKGIFHGAHWWAWDQDQGPFGAHGFEGQRVICFPTRDVVVVRLGKAPDSDDASERLNAHITSIADCFPEL